MIAKKCTRPEAWTLLNQYTQSTGLIKHALAVEACMEAYGEQQAAMRELSGDEASALIETYRITGLLHDFDYEKYPSAAEHPFVGNKILAEQEWPEDIRTAIMGHAQYSGVPRDTHLAQALFACDELAGFLTAVSLVKPTKSIFDVDCKVCERSLKTRLSRVVSTAKTSFKARRNWVWIWTSTLPFALPLCAATLPRWVSMVWPRRPLEHNPSPFAAEVSKQLYGDRFRSPQFAAEMRCNGNNNSFFFGGSRSRSLTVIRRDRFLSHPQPNPGNSWKRNQRFLFHAPGGLQKRSCARNFC